MSERLTTVRATTPSPSASRRVLKVRHAGIDNEPFRNRSRWALWPSNLNGCGCRNVAGRGDLSPPDRLGVQPVWGHGNVMAEQHSETSVCRGGAAEAVRICSSRACQD